MSKKPTTPKKPKNSVPEAEKVHPWRRCGKDERFVKEHTVHYKPCERFPDGLDCIRHAHCSKNPSGKDILTFSEIEFITKTYFKNLKHLPNKAKGSLLAYGAKANAFDHLIGGWVQYWNEVLMPSDPLDPDLIKALIATESSFDVNPEKYRGKVHGLTQIRNDTWEYLQGADNEIKQHQIKVEKAQLLDPSTSICCSVRWLFRKRVLAKDFLNRQVTWMEAVIAYKSYLSQFVSGKRIEPIEKMTLFLKDLKGK